MLNKKKEIKISPKIIASLLIIGMLCYGGLALGFDLFWQDYSLQFIPDSEKEVMDSEFEPKEINPLPPKDNESTTVFAADSATTRIDFFNKEEIKIGYEYQNKATENSDNLTVKLLNNLPKEEKNIKYEVEENLVKASWDKMEVRFKTYERLVKADYILLKKPSSPRLNFSITHSAQEIIQNNDDSLSFVTDDKEVFKLNKIKAWDKKNRIVNTSWKITDNNHISIVMDEKDYKKAKYPVTIDPTSQYTTLSQNATYYDVQVGSEVGVTSNNAKYGGIYGSDDVYWLYDADAGDPGGIDARIRIDGVEQNDANKLIVDWEGLIQNTSANQYLQICDWSSSTDVDAAAESGPSYDLPCDTGGWRTLNDQRTAYTGSTGTYDKLYHIYDGYWENSGSKVSTPISNFISSDGNKSILIRHYAPDFDASPYCATDKLHIEMAIDPLYQASGTTTTQGTATGTYIRTQATDNTSYSILGNGSDASDFYFSFTNVETYTGANAITVASETKRDGSSGDFKTKIYNFDTPGWEDLSGTAISDTSDTWNYFAKSNVDLDDYISSGEIRIGYYQTSAAAQSIFIDSLYIIVGTSNNNATTDCDVTWGTEDSGTDCTDTLSLDTTSTTAPWGIDTSTTGAAGWWEESYAGTWGTHHSASAMLDFDVTIPKDSQVTGLLPVFRFRSRDDSADNEITTQIAMRNYGTDPSSNNGGWTLMGSSNNSDTYSYYDGFGNDTDPAYESAVLEHIDSNSNKMNLRLETIASTETTAETAAIDYAFVSIRYVTKTDAVTVLPRQFVDGGAVRTGTDRALNNSNTRDYTALMQNNNIRWEQFASVGIADVRLYFDDVKLGAANKFIFEADAMTYSSGTDHNWSLQICDWFSSTDVDGAAESSGTLPCTNGGWRNVLDERETIADTYPSDQYRKVSVYDGYWSSSGTPTSTALSNFISTDGSRRILMRFYSSGGSGTRALAIDALNMIMATDPVYFPADFEDNSATTNNEYEQVFDDDDSYHEITNANDPNRFDVYYSFKNIATYTGMNTIVVVSKHKWDSAGTSYNLQIYNFNTSSWEDLNGTSLTGSVTESQFEYAKNNITISHYVSSGEVRIGYEATSDSTDKIQIDKLYIIAGTTNSATTDCEVTMGSGTDANCSNTRNLDTSSTASTWQITTDDWDTDGYYAFDDEWAGITADQGGAANTPLSVTVPDDAQVTAIHYAGRFRSNDSNIRIEMGARDWSGYDAGGWGTISATNNSSTYTYTDSVLDDEYITTTSSDAENMVHTEQDSANLRLRTDASTEPTIPTTYDWDFAFFSMRYIQPYTIYITGEAYTDDNEATPVTSTAVDGVVGSINQATATTDANGDFVLENMYAPPGEPITIFFDTGGGTIGSTVTISDGTNITDMRIYEDHVITRHEQGSDLSIIDMTQYDNDDDSDINFTATDASPDTLVIEDGSELYISATYTFDADGNLTAIDDIEIVGTYTATGSETITLSGSWINSGTFNAASSSVTFDSTEGVTFEVINSTGATTASFYDLTIAGAALTSFQLESALDVNNDLSITTGELDTKSGSNYQINVGGSWDNDDTFTARSGTVIMDATSGSLNIDADGTGTDSFYNLTLGTSGSAAWTLQTAMDVDNDFTIDYGTLSLGIGIPSITVGGSWDNNATFSAGNGTVTFDSADTGETVAAGSSDFNHVIFNNSGGGWTISENMTTDNLSITNATSFDATSRTIEVQGDFSNPDGSVTTWTGSTLYFNGSGGYYEVNSRTDTGDTYAQVNVGANENVGFWYSSYPTGVSITAGGSLLSQDHANVDGDLYIYGDYYSRSGEYWNYATDWEGTSLAGSERQTNVSFADGASFTLDAGDTMQVIGDSSNYTNISRISSGNYTIVIDGELTLSYFNFDYVDENGLQLTDDLTSFAMNNGSFDNAGAGTTSYYIQITDATLDTTSDNIVFDETGDGTDSVVDVNVAGDGSNIDWTFINYSGNKAGESYDEDLNGALINWLAELTLGLSANTIDLGQLETDSVSEENNTITVSTNAENGYQCSFAEDGNLRYGAADINDVSDGTVSAGSEEYGLNCSSGGCDLVNDTAVTGTPVSFSSSSGPVDSEVTTLLYRASIDNASPAGNFEHVVTITCAADF
ncbi:MAG: hypothetical protein ABIE68_01790 [bacterium]